MKNYACFKKVALALVLGCGLLFAQTNPYTFYFLPPNEDNWIAGNSYLYDSSTVKAELMGIDADKCGWFKKTFTTQAQIPENVLIFLGSQGRNKIDMEGMGADIGDSTQWIPLRHLFDSLGGRDLYFVADGLSFSKDDPGDLGEVEANRCSYKMAAFIYDTDNSVNPSFNGVYKALPNITNRVPNSGNGIRRGIVAPVLDTTDGSRKPVFAAPYAEYAGWIDKESFDAAFTPKGLYKGKISNIPRCYDMPFGRAANGTWEFDSDKMHPPVPPNDRYLVGGFYPYILDPAYNMDTDGTLVEYTDCPACNNLYASTCFNTMNATQLNTLTLTYKGVTYRGIEAFDRTPFPDGTQHHNYFTNNYGCEAPAAQIRPGFDGAKSTTANLSFCFESHAEFIYEKGQEFFFRGDDDIWVFINDQLVIDLGGVHQPAPGFVDLDTIKIPVPLEEGKRYPIDIFFCERMGTQSNVRVSTNMYIVQKSNFYDDPYKQANPMCASISSGEDCASKMNTKKSTMACGPNLIEEGYTVSFYMFKRGSLDTIQLNGKNAACEGSGNNFTCYGGIDINNAVYKCGGFGQCRGNQAATRKVQLSGNYTVYARLMKGGVQQGKPITIDNIKSETNTRIVWGNLKNEDDNSIIELKDAYGAKTGMEQYIIAGKRTPIYIAGGEWADVSDTSSYTSFVYYSDSERVAGLKYSLTGAAGLEITSDSLGNEKVTGSREIPMSGIDTLWVMGDYYLGENKFEINVVSSESNETPSLKLTVYQPTLKFMDSTFTKDVVPEGYLLWTEAGDTLPPFIGTALDVHIAAWDSLRNVLCDHCDFILTETSTTNSDSINAKWGENIVMSDGFIRLENGRQSVYIRGMDVVYISESNEEGVDADINYASWKIFGPSDGFTFAEWTKLQFRDSPVPQPVRSYVYDRNGDGIGDSLEVHFGKSFYDEVNGKIVLMDELLPVLLEVNWAKDTTAAFHHPDYTVKDLKDRDYVKKLYETPGFFEKNRKYWEGYIKDDSTLVIADANTAFSKNVQTFGYNSGKGLLLSYTPFYDLNKCPSVNSCGDKAFMYPKDGSPAVIFDRIPPIVVKAEYTMDKTKNCADAKPGCREMLVVYLSEPVFADTLATVDLFKNPFSYCFEYSQQSKCLPPGDSVLRHNQAWDNSGWDWETAKAKSEGDTSYTAMYKPSKQVNKLPRYSLGNSAKGDSTVDMIYYAYKIPPNQTTRMPKGNDWIKIRPPSSENGYDVFRDAEGNTANPREIGVLITGTNYYKKDLIKITGIDPKMKDPLGGIFLDNPPEGANPPWWISEDGRKVARDSLFWPGNVAELLPVPRGMKPDTVKKYYDPSVGVVFDVADNIANEVAKILEKCNNNCTGLDGKPLTVENAGKGITVYASAYYHTNIGNYTAHRDNIIANCTSDLFKDKDGVGDCFSNHYNFYLAWDLKANLLLKSNIKHKKATEGRFVGAGAYVAINKFYWQIDYKDSGGNLISDKKNVDEFIEMFGVRRKK
jgi:fibro-slime domain-containing protein